MGGEGLTKVVKTTREVGSEKAVMVEVGRAEVAI